MARSPSPDDDAALRWDEVDDPSYVESEAADAAAAREAAPSSADGDDVRASDADNALSTPNDPDAAAHDAQPARPRSGASTLLTAGFALVYLAYSVGWIIGIGLVPISGPTLLIEVLYQFSEFLAIIASALWFATVLALTRGGRAAHRVGWLALGTLLLLPWPFVLGVIG